MFPCVVCRVQLPFNFANIAKKTLPCIYITTLLCNATRIIVLFKAKVILPNKTSGSPSHKLFQPSSLQPKYLSSPPHLTHPTCCLLLVLVLVAVHANCVVVLCARRLFFVVAIAYVFVCDCFVLRELRTPHIVVVCFANFLATCGGGAD